MGDRSLAGDLQKVARLFKKVSDGELSMQDLFEDACKDPEEKAEALRADKACSRYVGCTLKDGHKGGCCIDAVCEVSPVK